LKELSEQVNHCPLLEEDINKHPFLRKLVKYQVNIIRKPFSPHFVKPGFRDYLDIYLRWLSFIIQHPNEIPYITTAYLKSIYTKKMKNKNEMLKY